MDNKALLVVDVQQGLFNKVMKVYEADLFIKHINKLIKFFHSTSSQVVFIRHTNKSLLKENSPDWNIHTKLENNDKDIFINKHKSNVFGEGNLIKELKSKNITEVIVVGLVSHGCVKAACLGAIDEGLQVTFISDGHSNFNKRSKEIILEINEEMKNYKVKIISTDMYIQSLSGKL